MVFLSSQGELTQLTQLSALYDSPSIFSASISPNERYLAFEVVTNFKGKTGNVLDRRLLILNTDTQEIIDYCISPEQFARLVWSPDSRYLAFSRPITNKGVQTIVLDVSSGRAFVVANDFLPGGWLILEK